MNLAEHMFPGSRDAIRILSNDPSTAFHVAKQVGKRILGSNEFLAGFSFEAVSAIMSQAGFASGEEECVVMSSILMGLAGKNDILPMITIHRDKELASRCVVSLGMFMPAMEERCRRHGAPQPSFYRGIGVAVFKNNDMPDISEHFTKWEGFLGEMFVL